MPEAEPSPVVPSADSPSYSVDDDLVAVRALAIDIAVEPLPVVIFGPAGGVDGAIT